MVDTICIFEDEFHRRLLPLVHMRPVYDLRCGMHTLRQKIVRQYPGARLALHVRSTLAGLVREQNPGIPVNELGGEGCLFINGRLLASHGLAQLIPLEGPDAVYTMGEMLVAARLSGPTYPMLHGTVSDPFFAPLFRGLPRNEVAATLIEFPWDLINRNGGEIAADFEQVAPPPGQRIQGVVYEGAHLVEPACIVIGEGTRVKPGVVVAAEDGPVFIGRNATIFPNAVIEGPAFIGDRTLIKAGAKIYGNTSIGEVCKVGGEVECSIIHSHSNKQHDGFLGHAYLGMWVNLGADTNNSDLKNNYSNVKVEIGGQRVDTGHLFVGLTMGDHVNTSIGTCFNTGTVVGPCCNIFGTGLPPKNIPAYSWGGTAGFVTYDVEKCISVARVMMARRGVECGPVDEAMLRTVFEQTVEERSQAGVRPGPIPDGAHA